MTYPNYRTYISHRILFNSVKRENGCIEYAGGGLKHKYGLISITLDKIRKSVPAHRALYMAVNDCLDLPGNIHIRHKCDNPCCVNIDHLIRGTPKQNVDDKLERGRNAKKYRLHTRHVKFSEEIIRLIRDEPGKLKHVAEKFGTTTGYVSKIKNYKAKTLIQ